MKQFFLFLTIFSIIILLSVLFLGSSIPELYSTVLGSLAIQSGLFFSAMFFLWENNLKKTLSSIGFPGSLKNTIIFTFLGLVLLFFILLLVGLVATLGSFNDQEKISDKVTNLPFAILLFAIFIAPICEELFFRALLVPKADSFFFKLVKIPHLGVFASSLLFGISHISYGSVVEILGVLAIGILLAAFFKASKSITPCILIHMIYNGLSISAMLLLNSKI